MLRVFSLLCNHWLYYNIKHSPLHELMNFWFWHKRLEYLLIFYLDSRYIFHLRHSWALNSVKFQKIEKEKNVLALLDYRNSRYIGPHLSREKHWVGEFRHTITNGPKSSWPLKCMLFFMNDKLRNIKHNEFFGTLNIDWSIMHSSKKYTIDIRVHFLLLPVSNSL